MSYKVVITGGAGFIGSHLATYFVEEEAAEVVIIDNFASGYRKNLAHLGSQVRIVEGDIRSRKLLAEHFVGARFVLHQAAIVSVPYSVENPIETEMVNALGTLHVLLAAHDAGVERVTLAASAAAYGVNPTLPKCESMEVEPNSPYAATKISAELYARVFTQTYNLPVFPLRYFNIYGARQDPSGAYAAVISKFVDCFLKDIPPTIFGDGTQSRDFCHVSNVVQANVAALLHAPIEAAGKPINIGTGSRTNLLTLINTLSEIFDRKVEPIFQKERAGDVPHSVADISMARKHLHYEPQTKLFAGLRELVNASKTENNG